LISKSLNLNPSFHQAEARRTILREEGSFPDGYEWRGDYPEDLEKLPSNQAIKESEHHKYEDMNAELEQHAMHCFQRMTTFNGQEQ
jgi:hypothetical protein